MVEGFENMTDEERAKITRELKSRRKDYCIPLREVAMEVGCSSTFLSYFERGLGRMPTETARAYEEFLDKVAAGEINPRRSIYAGRSHTVIRSKDKPRPAVSPTPVVRETSTELGLGAGLLRRSLGILASEACMRLNIDKQTLLQKEAGISVMTLGEVSRLLAFYWSETKKLQGELQLEISFPKEE